MDKYRESFRGLLLTTSAVNNYGQDEMLCSVISRDIDKIIIAVEDLYNAINNKISTEGFIDKVKEFIAFIKKTIENILDYFKILFNKLTLKFQSYLLEGNDMVKKLSTMRNKDHITISETTYKYYLKNFGSEDFNNIEDTVDIIKNLSNNYKVLTESIINNRHIDKYIIYSDFLNTKEVIVNKDGLLELINNDKISIKDDKLEIVKNRLLEVKYDVVLNLADAIESTNKNLTSFIKDLNDITNNIKRTIEEIGKSNTFTTDVNIKLKNLLFLQRNLPSNILKSYSSVIRKCRILLNLIYNDGLATSDLMYKEFINKVKNDKEYYNNLPFKECLGDISKLKLIDNGKMLYISTSGINYAKGWGIPPAITIRGDKLLINESHFDSKSYSPSMHINRKLLEEEKYDYNSIRESGLILICEEIINRLLRESESKITFDFIYYHEVGHLITGQERKIYKVNPNNFFDYETNEIEKYINNEKENKSDAYACLMTGISPEDVWEYRLWEFNRSMKDIDSDLVGDKYNIDSERVDEYLKNISNRKQEFINNVRKQMSTMEPYVKRGPMGWLKLLLTKRN